MICGPGDKRLKWALRLGKRDLRTLVALLTGHAPLGAHLFKMKLYDKNECRYCGGEPETTVHLIAECTGTEIENAREKIFGLKKIEQEKLKCLDERKLLKFAKLTGIQDIITKKHNQPP